MRKSLVQFLAVPVLLGLAIFAVGALPYSKYDRLLYGVILFIFITDIATIVRGKTRDAAVVLLSLLFGLMAAELLAIRLEAHPLSREPRDFIASDPVLGWGPARSGVFKAQQFGPGATAVYNVSYTIDENLTRYTASASDGPLAAFFGDSMTFGEGLEDSETLPQAFADIYARRLRVLNLAFPGYGPQQFLRAIEAGRFDGLLQNGLKLIVYQTAPWHATRSSCKDGFTLRAPKYELDADNLVYAGACAEGFMRAFREAIGNAAFYRVFLRPFAETLSATDIELYLAEIQKAAQLAKERYGAATAILYLPAGRDYLNASGFTDEAIANRLRAAGLQVVNGDLDPKDFPAGTALSIPGDSHPSAIAQRARAEILASALGPQLFGLPAQSTGMSAGLRQVFQHQGAGLPLN
ncbi:MAG: SGNH/GDSL hydrolase family protein [Methylocapsa sp.]|nr:SGNH/GDSL hydrolase family protein [Methylocapsa sp.]